MPPAHFGPLPAVTHMCIGKPGASILAPWWGSVRHPWSTILRDYGSSRQDTLGSGAGALCILERFWDPMWTAFRALQVNIFISVCACFRSPPCTNLSPSLRGCHGNGMSSSWRGCHGYRRISASSWRGCHGHRMMSASSVGWHHCLDGGVLELLEKGHHMDRNTE